MHSDRSYELQEHFLFSPLGQSIRETITWGKQHSHFTNVELFLNPADAEPLPAGWTLFGLPVCRSIGVPPGGALIFDRDQRRYLRPGELP